MSQLSPNRRAHLGGSGAHPKIETAPGIADERRPGASQGARERTRTSTAKNGYMVLKYVGGCPKSALSDSERRFQRISQTPFPIYSQVVPIYPLFRGHTRAPSILQTECSWLGSQHSSRFLRGGTCNFRPSLISCLCSIHKGFFLIKLLIAMPSTGKEDYSTLRSLGKVISGIGWFAVAVAALVAIVLLFQEMYMASLISIVVSLLNLLTVAQGQIISCFVDIYRNTSSMSIKIGNIKDARKTETETREERQKKYGSGSGGSSSPTYGGGSDGSSPSKRKCLKKDEVRLPADYETCPHCHESVKNGEHPVVR
jgi:hypothetical protein